MGEQPLTGGRVTRGVVRIGDTVRRPMTGDRRLQQLCLRHLEAVGSDGTPRFLGFDDEDRAMLSFLPGEVPVDLSHYTDRQLAAAADLLRRFHDATASLEAVRAGGGVACHNDFAPTNAVFRDGLPYALIDFDTLRPGNRLWDVGYSAFTWLDLGDTDYDGTEQLRRLRIFVAAYNHPACTVAATAVFAVARQTALAASAAKQNDVPLTQWAGAAATWTALNVLEVLLPTGYAPFVDDR